MGTNQLNKLPASPVQTDALPEQYNDLIDALTGKLVMRNTTTGLEEDGISDIGESSTGRPRDIFFTGDLIQDGKILDTAPYLKKKTTILSGKSKTSGFPNYLYTNGGNTFKILGATTQLSTIIDGESAILFVDIESKFLSFAPSGNNTCLINNADFTGQYFRATTGEYGGNISIDTVGSNITALNGTIQCFKVGTGGPGVGEVFLAMIDTSNNRLIPYLRGIGGTTRTALNNNNVLQICKTAYIFLKNDLITIDTTYNYPSWGFSAPSTPTSGDFWFDNSLQTWKKWSGSEWQEQHWIYMGYTVADDTGYYWVQHEDFDLSWDGQFKIDKIVVSDYDQISIEGDIQVNVASQKIFIRNFKSDLIFSTHLDTGISETASTWYYLYLKSTGEMIFSDQAPRKYDWRLGWYHPNEYWRMIGFVWNDIGSNLLYSTIVPEYGVMLFDANFTYSAPLATPYVLVPSIIKKVEINVGTAVEPQMVGLQEKSNYLINIAALVPTLNTSNLPFSRLGIFELLNNCELTIIGTVTSAIVSRIFINL